MLKLKRVAVTGGISCGKSTVCRLFKELGAYVVSADEIVHQLLSIDTDLGKKTLKLLGSDIVVDGQIDRARMAEKVFNQPQLLKSLENLIHPAVFDEIKRKYEIASRDKSTPLFVAEIPLLFEANGEHLFDASITVAADQELCKKRFDSHKQKLQNPKNYEKRMARQLPLQEKIKRADYVIYNNGTIQEMEAEIRKLFDELVKNSHPTTIINIIIEESDL